MKTHREIARLLVSTGILGLMLWPFSGAAAAEATYEVNIPAESLGRALTDFSQATSQQIIFSESVVKGRTSVPLKGRYTAAEGLSLLLNNSNLISELSPAGVLMVKPKNAVAAREAAGLQGSVPAAADSAALETVLVSAQKRLESGQVVPISLTTLSSRQLDLYRVQNLGDLSRLVPGLLVSTFSSNSPTIAIRGASNTFQQIGVSKPVQVVVDDVFVPRPSGAVFELFDLESVNVLEGPQGTLFGRNVTGGAIVIQTRKPDLFGWAASAELSGGNLGNIQFNGLANIPLTDSIAANFSVSVRHRDGYGSDRLTGRDQDDINSQNYRLNVLTNLTDDLSVLLSGDYSYDWNNGRTLSSTSLGDDGNPRTSELGVAQSFNRALGGGSLKAVWNTGVGELTSITAYRRTQSGEYYSGVGASYTLLATGAQSLVRDNDQVGTFSHEMRYASPRWETGDFVAGIYILDEDGNRQLGTEGLAAKTGVRSTSTEADSFVHTVSYAGFVDGTLHLLPTLDLTAGVRYTTDEKSADMKYTDAIRPTNNFTITDRYKSWSQFTPRGVLTWRPAEEAMLYVTVSRGFTAGGFNTNATSAAAFALTFDPETVTNYEIGAKTQWFDDTLRFNASIFQQDYHNKQELVFNSTNAILDIVNAAAATAKGFELSLAYKPLSWLELGASYAHLDTIYDSFVLGTTNNTGHRLSSSPPNKYAFSADLNYPLDAVGFIIGSVNYSWTDSYNTGAAADARLQIPNYGLMNVNLGYESPDHRYRLTLWARNLGDTKYVLTNSTQVITATYLGEPRTWGITLRTNF